MSLKLTVNVPGSLKGQPIEVHGLGVFSNGESHEVSDEAVQQAVSAGMQPESILGEGLELIVGDPDAELGGVWEEEPKEAIVVDEPEAPVETAQDASDDGGTE